MAREPMSSADRPTLRLITNTAEDATVDAGEALSHIYRTSRYSLIRFLGLLTSSVAEAEDLAQSAYLKLFARAECLDAANLRSLLFITARNLALDLRRQKRRHARVIVDNDDDAGPIGQVACPLPDAERTLIAREHVEIIGKLIDELPSKCRKAFIAYKFVQRDYCDIAVEMGVSESMVRKYIIRAVNHCATRFEEMEGWE